jgi:hypothetical protein
MAYLGSMMWPREDERMAANLADAACKPLLEHHSLAKAHPEVFDLDAAEARPKCSALAVYLDAHPGWNIQSAEEHARDLRKGRVRATTVPLAMWVVSVSLVYLAGWAVSWIRSGFRKE